MDKHKPTTTNAENNHVGEVQKYSARKVPARLLTISFITTLAGFISYWAPYVVGLTYYKTLLSSLDVPFHLFERSSSDYFIYAHHAIIEASSSWINLLFRETKLFLYIMCTVAALALEIALINWLSKTKLSNKISKKVEGSGLVSVTVAVLALAFIAAFAIAFFPIFILIVLIIPGIIGEYAAESVTRENNKIYLAGCVQNKKNWNCVKLLDDTKEVSRGFLITSSNERVALHLGGKTSIFFLGEKTLETVLPPQTKDN